MRADSARAHPPLALAPLLSLLLALLLPPAAAYADADDTISITPSIGWMHDDNLFRLSSGELSEDVTIASLTLKANKRYSLQRFEFETSYIDYRYKNYSYLSYDATPYKGAWRWSLTPYLHGNLSADRVTTLNSFDDYSGYTRRNLNTTKNSRFDGMLDVSPSWHLLGGISHRSYENTELTQGEGNNRVDSTDFGLSYTPASGATISLVSRNGDGEYYNRSQPIPAPLYFDNGFSERENTLRLHWPVTGKTTVDARLGYLEREHDNFASRDYSGVVGNVSVNWIYSGNALLTAIASRELASYQTINSNYTVTDRIGLMPTWQLDGKTVLRLRYDYAQRDYLGAPGLLAPSLRSDTMHIGLVALEWNPLRTATISASLQTEIRNSNQSGIDYDDNIFNLSAQMTF